jgi:hypothetical protein
MFDGAFAVVLIRNGVRTRYDSWLAATPYVEIGDEVRGYMPNGTTGWAEIIHRGDRSEGIGPWRAVQLFEGA